MDEENKKPEGRKVTASGTGKKLGKKGEGLGTGPVNNMGNYADRKEQQEQQAAEAKQPKPSAAKKPAGNPKQPEQGSDKSILSSLLGGGISGQSSQQSGGFSSLLGGNSAQNQSQQQKPANLASLLGGGSNQSQQQKPANLASLLGGGSNQSSSQQSGNGGGSLFGGNKKILLIILAIVAIYFLYKTMTGNNQNEDDSSLPVNTASQSAGSSFYDDEDITPTSTVKPVSSDVNSALNLFMGTAYDYNGSGTSSDSGEAADTTVSGKARAKFTKIKGNKKDAVTLLVYLCGTDLESQSGMATADLKEMLNASVSGNVRILIYTGGCSRWKNNVMSSKYNEVYLIEDGALTRLEENLTGYMTDPKTLTWFIQYGKKNYSANRMCLILWDHGGGSVSGYGYDEKAGRGQSMNLSGINTALKNAGVKFDFIGFDACLMATVETGLVLSQYADYMIASEETEPGVGWYYTNWLTKLSKNPSMSTVEIGKLIADDFVDVCAKQCRGQATTLSVVDLAELQAAVPSELAAFSRSASKMIKNKEYQKLAKARGATREFAQSSRIDQIDLVDFAARIGTKESKKLAKALQSTVKYNRSTISGANGLSIYFPYQRASNVKNAVSVCQAIDMEEDWTRCIQDFASLETSGQVASSGSSYGSYSSGSTALPGLLDILGGGSSSASGTYGMDLTDLLGGMLGGDSSYGNMLDLFTGRALTLEESVDYVTENHLDDSLLNWNNHRIILPTEQADLINDVALNVFYDVGDGYLDLGMDDIRYTWEDNTLVENYDGVWLHYEDQPVAYYYLYRVSDNTSVGYIPAMLRRQEDPKAFRVNLLVLLEGSKGQIIGAQKIYGDEENNTEAKNMIDFGAGDEVTFVCDAFDYQSNYQDTYPISDTMILSENPEITYRYLEGSENCRATLCLTDIYSQRHWTNTIDMGK